MPSFFNGKRFFLTYPQCASIPEELLFFLREQASVDYYLISKETHKDGSPHLHACVEFSEHQRHGVSWLDFNGKHPNKQDPRNWGACKTYCRKDGNFIETAQDISIISKKPQLGLLALCETFDKEEDWMAYCCDNKITFQYGQWFWNRVHSELSTILVDDHPGVIHPCLIAYEFVKDGKTLVLCGDSGTGKTTWAKIHAPKPSLFCSHIDELKSFRVGFHKSIIFDDVDFNHYPRTSQIAIVDFDNPRQVHCSHSCAKIPSGIYKIFTCNSLPLLLSDEAIKRRCRVVNVRG